MIFEIAINGITLKGFSNFTYADSFKDLCATLQATIPSTLLREVIIDGNSIVALICNRSTIFKGYLDSMRSESNAGSAQIAARSLTSVLLDSALRLGYFEKNNLSFKNLLQEICKRLHLELIIEDKRAEKITIKKFSYEKEDSAFSVIDKLARQNGFLLDSGPGGELIVASYRTDKKNPLSIVAKDYSVAVDYSKRFREYRLRYESRASREKKPLQKEVTVYDDGVNRSTLFSKAYSDPKTLLASEGEFEKKVREIQSETIAITSASPFSAEGKFLSKNRFVTVAIGALSRTLLIEGFSLSMSSESGSEIQLALVDSDKFIRPALSFRDTFSQARKAGLSVFFWNGKEYTTQLAATLTTKNTVGASFQNRRPFASEKTYKSVLPTKHGANPYEWEIQIPAAWRSPSPES